jgi:hypothetical protein
MGNLWNQPKPFIHTTAEDNLSVKERNQLLHRIYSALTGERYRLIERLLNAYLIPPLVALAKEYLGNVITRAELTVFFYATSISSLNAAHLQANRYSEELPLNLFMTTVPCTNYFLKRLFHGPVVPQVRFNTAKNLSQAHPHEITHHFSEKIHEILVSRLYSLILEKSRNGRSWMKICFYSPSVIEIKTDSIDHQWKEVEFHSWTLKKNNRARLSNTFKSWNIKAIFEEMKTVPEGKLFYILVLEWHG